MPRSYVCVSCDWNGREVRDPGRCPHCGGITQRDFTVWDGLQSDLVKVAAFVLVASAVIGLWTWLCYPFVPDGNESLQVRFRISSAGFVETPQGQVARFEIVNDSIHLFAQVRITPTIFVYKHNHPDPVGPGLPSNSITIANLGPRASKVFEVPLDGRRTSDLFGWNAKLESYELPPGYWNKRLQSGLSVRLEGLVPNVPAAFPQTVRRGQQ